jgi:hypothetical protein
MYFAEEILLERMKETTDKFIVTGTCEIQSGCLEV